MYVFVFLMKRGVRAAILLCGERQGEEFLSCVCLLRV
jgi:hypothetical protein